MKVISRKSTENALRRRFDAPLGGWYYNIFEEGFQSKPINVSSRVKIETLIRYVTVMHSICGGGFPLLAFPNGNAGWKKLNRKFRHSTLLVPSSDDIKDIVTRQMCFREQPDKKGMRREDNYHFSDPEFHWIAVFCHHDDFHLFSDKESLRKFSHAKKSARRGSIIAEPIG